MPEIIFKTGTGTFSGDISANDASFNNVGIEENLKVRNNLEVIGDISANDVSLNNIDIEENLKVINNLEVIGDISANDASFNNLNASNINIVSPDFIALYITRENSDPNAGCMIKIRKSGASTTPWQIGSLGLSSINNNFTIEPTNVGQGSCVKIQSIGSAGGVNALTINNTGTTGHNLKVNGSAFCSSGSWASDDRIKYNEEDVEGLKVIRQLNPKKYNKLISFGTDMSGEYNNWMPPTDISFNEDLDRYKHNEECGLIAQDILESDVSFVVIQDIDKNAKFNSYGVDYTSIFTYAIQAIKELDEKQTNHYNEIIELKTKVNDLEAENEILKGLIK